MKKQFKKINHNIDSFLTFDIEVSESLAELALDLNCTWNHASDEIWEKIDPDLWKLTHNPWGILQTVSGERIENLLKDPEFRKKVDELLTSKKQKANQPGWFQIAYPKPPFNSVAYFSMEFMLDEALPIYAGGLGNVAGDQLKAASDLGIPVIGIGLLYQQGYFRQVIDKYGAQHAVFPYNHPGQLPITPLRQANGEWLRVKVDLPGNTVLLRAWQVKVGRAFLYLLDSNDVANSPIHRGITSELYGGGQEMRLQQEIILGIGGWKLLSALGIQPEVCHLNEGHAAFAVLERARSFMERTGQPFDLALTATRSGNLFTTHTAVAAGFDVFPPYLIERYLGSYAVDKLGIKIEDLLALGRQNPQNPSENFNMAYLAIRGSGAVNGVSRLHGKVSREIFTHLFPNWPKNEVPVQHITNGVHMSSWDSEAADRLWTEACGKDRWRGTIEMHGHNIRQVSDERLWQMRNSSSLALVKFVRERVTKQSKSSGAFTEAVTNINSFFDPNTLTLGFARRFATYKRPNLLLHNPERLLRILTDPKRPVQLIIAGKAHPADKAGQYLIQQWINFIRNTEAKNYVVFLCDYDMLLTEHLVQGVDVWLNTPRRPWEACGTSGMKVLVNGGINISELDGWWEEAYSPEIGWALGDGLEHGDDPNIDAAEADALYNILEKEVVPEFYTRNEKGIPVAWVARMRESMARLTPQFSANRAVREYTEHHYIPAAMEYHKRSENNGEGAKKILDWQNSLKENWSALRFVDVKIETNTEYHNFEVQVYVDDFNQNELKVELFADAVNGHDQVRLEMKYLYQLPGAINIHVYAATVSAERPADDYTARIVPYFPGVNVPLETSQILWQK
jgi:starch phosphorylase